MKIVVTGARGLLGSEVVKAGGTDVVGLGRDALDVTDDEACRAVIPGHEPDWLIHCAAYTAVDRAEDEPDEAMRVNHGGTVNVAKGAAAAGAGLVYVSTDYVFGGRKRTPYAPTDPVEPLSVYARTKRAGEEAALAAGGVVVRTGWLYGPGGPNFVDAILERAEAGEPLKVVDDQWGRPTRARNVAEVMLELLTKAAPAIWHVADRGEATWLELAREACRLRGVAATLEGVSTEAWGAAAPRPGYSVLDLTETERVLGRPMVPWREALRLHLEEDRYLEEDRVTGGRT